MKLKYSLRVGGQDYTDRLLSVSSIDTGVKGLGFGYISDITLECAYDSNLMSAVGQSAEVGLLIEGASTIYKGTVEKVSLQGGKVSLSLRAKRPEEQFKPRQRVYIGVYDKHVAVPVVYGNGSCYARLLATQKKTDGLYQLLVGDNPNVSSAYQYSSGVYVIDARVRVSQDPEHWDILPDGTTIGWDISQYSANQYLGIHRYCHKKYGVKRNGDGSTSETLLGSTDWVFVQGGQYQWIKFVAISGCLIDSWQPVQVYTWDDLAKDREISDTQRISVSSISSPSDIIADILQRNGIAYSLGSGFLIIDLCFQADESFKDIVQKCAEQGLIYIVPHHDSFKVVPAVFSSVSPIYTFTESVFLPQSVSVERPSPPFNTVTVLYDREGASISSGSGSPEKEYRADFITDSTSAQTFADAYLQYHQKTMKVKFSTPLLPELLGIDVGDVVKVNYGLYGISRNFQVVQRTIRKERIDWMVREL